MMSNHKKHKSHKSHNLGLVPFVAIPGKRPAAEFCKGFNRKKSYPRRAAKRDGSAASAGLRPGKPAGALEEQEWWEEAPPGSAGVPPACTPVASRSVSLRCGTRPLCRRVRHGRGRSRVLGPLPVEPGGGDERGCAKSCAGGTPALPGGLHPLTSLQQRRSSALV